MTQRLVAVHELAGAERIPTIAAMAALHATAFAPAWSAAEIAALLDHPGAVAFVISANTQSTAFAIGRAAAGEAEVLTIVTAPDAQRRGHARALLAMLETALEARGAATLFLEVAEDNLTARAFYAKAQFTQSGRRRGYYPRPGQPPVDAVVLRKRLRSS